MTPKSIPVGDLYASTVKLLSRILSQTVWFFVCEVNSVMSWRTYRSLGAMCCTMRRRISACRSLNLVLVSLDDEAAASTLNQCFHKGCNRLSYNNLSAVLVKSMIEIHIPPMA
uniref:ORF12 n=1 Tax=Malaco herpesvirus 4 TaxID=3031800 RepID=A0AA48P8Z1_9VIRU|nr:TPA_asm: ORF12 [Malaco herpesvirus 4]